MNDSFRTLPNSSFKSFLPNDAIKNFLNQGRNNEKDEVKLRSLQNMSQINVTIIDKAETRNECCNLARKKVRLQRRRVSLWKVTGDVEEWIELLRIGFKRGLLRRGQRNCRLYERRRISYPTEKSSHSKVLSSVLSITSLYNECGRLGWKLPLNTQKDSLFHIIYVHVLWR